MIIKKPADSVFFNTDILKRLPKFFKDYALFWYLVVALFTGIVLGAFVHKTEVIGNVIKPLFLSNYRAAAHLIEGRFAAPERIGINIKFLDFQKLAYKRKEALAAGALISSPDDFVPALISYQGKILKAKIRIKGTLTDQLHGEKWPFRIEMNGVKTLFGMKRFSIAHPSARSYVNEWFLHQAMRREGIISLRYDFIDVTLNGKDLGIYALEEHFEKRLLENNHRIDGPIINFSEKADVANIWLFGWPTDKRVDFYSGEIDVYYANKSIKDPELSKQFMVAKNLLESFREGKLKTSDVFDINILAKYFALADLLNAGHAAKYGNLNFYYNPITAKLEPIFFDAEISEEDDLSLNGAFAENWCKNIHDPWRLFFSDYDFFALYMKELQRFSEPNYLDALFSEVKPQLDKKLRIIYRDYPWYYFNRNKFYANQAYMQKIIDPLIYLHAYFKGYYEENGEKFIELNISNIKSIPIRILNLSLKGRNDFIFQLAGDKKLLGPSMPNSLVNTEKFVFTLPKDFEWKGAFIKQLQLNYNLLGVEKQKNASIIAWNYEDEDFVNANPVIAGKNINECEFLLIDEGAKKISIKPGEWRLSESLVIPEGYAFICERGVRLNLVGGGKIISHSPLAYIGNEDSPIIIQSDNSEGIAVLNAKGQSVLEHVIFKGLGEPSQGAWRLSGGLTFYNSPVRINHCQFLGSRSRDGLYLVDSEFDISQSVFSNASANALHADFSKGSIRDTSFVACVKDALSISRSILDVQNISIDGKCQRGLNISQDTQMTAKNIFVKNSNIAVLAKEGAALNILGGQISDCDIGFAVYRENPEFGAANVNAQDLKWSGVKTLASVEDGCILLVNGRNVTGQLKDF